MLRNLNLFLKSLLIETGLSGLTQLLRYLVLFLIKDLILLLIQGRSLSPMVTISFRTKLLMILRIVVVKMKLFHQYFYLRMLYPRQKLDIDDINTFSPKTIIKLDHITY